MGTGLCAPLSSACPCPMRTGLKACEELPSPHSEWQPGRAKVWGEGCRNLEPECKGRACPVWACCLASPQPSGCSHPWHLYLEVGDCVSWSSPSSITPCRWVPGLWEHGSPRAVASPSGWWEVAAGAGGVEEPELVGAELLSWVLGQPRWRSQQFLGCSGFLQIRNTV